MVGWFYWVEGQRQVEVISLLGVPILKVGWTVPRRDTERAWKKQAAKGGAFLNGQGCRRILCASGTPYSDQLFIHGLRPVDTTPLCRHLADRLALAHLAGRGISPTRATVLLQGERVDCAMSQTAYALCPFVRTLMIKAAHGGSQLAVNLQNRFGVAVLKEGVPDITLVFSGEKFMPIQPNTLFLAKNRIFLDGYQLAWLSGILPQGLEEIFFLTLLWEGKQIPSHEIAVIPII